MQKTEKSQLKAWNPIFIAMWRLRDVKKIDLLPNSKSWSMKLRMKLRSCLGDSVKCLHQVLVHISAELVCEDSLALDRTVPAEVSKLKDPELGPGFGRVFERGSWKIES